jgi:hypothetical protein
MEMHHVIPRCMGGGDELENLVYLTAEEHCVAHLLLAKIHPDNTKLGYAAANMSRLYPGLKLPKNKRYARARRAMVQSGGGWERTRRGNAIRARKRKEKGYKKADVARLARMLEARTIST